MAPEAADVAAEPHTPERPQLPTQDVRFINNDLLRTDELLNFTPSGSSDSSADTTYENSVYISNFPTANNSESLKAQFSSANLPNSCDFRPRLPPRDYREKAIETKYRLKCAVFRLVNELLRRIN